MMKFAIAGAGGTGGCIGAYLAAAGNDVTFLARNRHLAAINTNGLTIKRGFAADIHIQPAKACTMEDYNDTPDVLFICFKYYGLEAAIDLARRVANKDTLIIPILNIFGTGEIMQEKLPDLTCLDGCIYIWAKIAEPGVIDQPEKIMRVFYGFRPGQTTHLQAKAAELEKIMRAADIHAHVSDDIRRDALQKFAFVSPMGAAGLYLNSVSRDFQEPGEKRDLFIGLIKEIHALGTAMGIEFNQDLVATGLRIMDASQPNLTTSMQRDVASGGPSEFSGLVARVVELGNKYHVAVPLYQKIADWGRANNLC